MSAPLILGTNSIKDTASYEVANSCRFNGAINNDETLIKTFGTATNRKKFTFSVWIKLSGRGQGNNNGLLVAGTTGNDEGTIKIANDNISWSEYDADTASVVGNLQSNKVLRDYSAWQHLVFRWDSTDSTAGDRMQIYHNGTRLTSFSATTNPSVNYEGALNGAVLHNIGRQSWNNSGDFNGYMAEIFFIDGTALNADSFGEFDSLSNIWKPKDCKDNFTFGNNGFYLEFKQSGTGTNSSGIGADTSGNNNHFAVNNLTSLSQSTDTCTNNFCTLNPLTKRSGGNGTLTEGNLQYEASGGDSSVFGTIGIPPGMKVYFEVKLISNTAQNSIGIHNLYDGGDGDFVKGGDEAGTYAYKVRGAANDTQYFNNGSLGGTVVSNYSANTIIGVAVDNENGQIHYSANGTFINSSDPTDNNPVALVTGFGGSNEQYLHFSLDTSGGTNPKNQFNFGSPPYSISSGNSDAEGFGNFEYAVPSGYFALCTKNLAEYG